MKSKKLRLDDLLVERGLAETKSRAKALILSGEVLVNNEPVTKAGSAIAYDAEIRVKEQLKYVSRGGLKLEAALREFSILVKDQVCLDVGASTGGFTDCLLQHGARHVHAIDVGYGQMHWKLQTDTRVTRYDRENFRYFDLTKIVHPVSLLVMDVSFISVRLLIPKIAEIAKLQTQSFKIVLLVKPQFEVGREYLSKGGIVRDEAARENSLNQVVQDLAACGWKNIQHMISPITGADGNVEYLLSAEY